MSRTYKRFAFVLALAPFFCAPAWVRSAEKQADPSAEKAIPPTAPPPGQIGKAIERGLVFVEKGGVAWLRQTKAGQCLSCHQGPMMLWSLNEARKLGFPINPQRLDEITRRAVGRRIGATDNPEEVPYLALAVAAAPQVPDAALATAQRNFGEFVVKVQHANGYWQVNNDENPLGRTAVNVLWTALALSAAHDTIARQSKDAKLPLPDSWAKSQEKAIQWVTESKAPAEPLLLVPRLLLEVRAGRAEEVRTILKQLKAWQNSDGGWSWKKGQPSDAYMTGQVLYALSLAGVPASDPVVPRALSFLVDTQREDGSWLVVHTLKPTLKNNSEIFTYAATAWATMGMMRYLSPEAKPAEAEKAFRN